MTKKNIQKQSQALSSNTLNQSDEIGWTDQFLLKIPKIYEMSLHDRRAIEIPHSLLLLNAYLVSMFQMLRDNDMVRMTRARFRFLLGDSIQEIAEPFKMAEDDLLHIIRESTDNVVAEFSADPLPSWFDPTARTKSERRKALRFLRRRYKEFIAQNRTEVDDALLEHINDAIAQI